MSCLVFAVCCSTLRSFETFEVRMMNGLSDIVNKGVETIIERSSTFSNSSCEVKTPTDGNTTTNGTKPQAATKSCDEIITSSPGATSGKYYLQSKDSKMNGSVAVYCELEKEIKGNRGFMRIANVNMSDPNTDCPDGLSLRTDGNLRTCQRNQIHSGCSSTSFSSSGVEYSRVCGRIRGYQWASPNAFYYTSIYSSPKIEDNYVDGVVLTNQVNESRSHIWTFAAALDETRRNRAIVCQCSNVNVILNDFKTPSFVGNDYFCETGSRHGFSYGVLYTEDPLWDGKGCGTSSSCCDKGEWFCKDVPKTSSDIELRLCSNEDRINEDTPIELIELYIQ